MTQAFQFITAPLFLPEGQTIGLYDGRLAVTLRPMAAGSYGFVRIVPGRWM